MNDIVVQILRSQAWERAKAELQAMLATYYSPTYNTVEQFQEADVAVQQFIEYMESSVL